MSIKNSIDTIGDRTRDLPISDLGNYETSASSRQKLNRAHTHARAHTHRHARTYKMVVSWDYVF